MKRRILSTLVAASLACWLGGANAAKVAAPDDDEPDLVPTGKGWGERATPTPGYVTNNGNGQAGKGGGKGNGITYHGGPVILGSVPIHLIWYGNWSGNSATSILPTLIGDLSDSSYFGINTTYYNGSNQHVSGTAALASQTNDNYSRGTALSDADIQAIVASHVGSSADANAVYFVLTSADVNETSGFCTQYCGWHTHGTIGGKDIKYSFVGNPDRCPSACAAQTTGPNGNAGADGMASIIAHESEEAISDPDLNAWYDSRGQENADKCAWTFGTTATASNGSQYNFVGASGRQWLIQRNWVNASGGYCSMTYP